MFSPVVRRLITRVPSIRFVSGLSTAHSSIPIPSANPPKRKSSLVHTARSFNQPELKLNITNKKYSEQGKLLTIDIAPRAIEKLTDLMKSESNPDLALRISVESGGCHGFQYNLDLSNTNTLTEDDCLFEKGGAKILIDDSSLNVLKESKVDYTTELIGSMFKIVESPYMVSSCGCGSSFDIDFDKLG